ncbi:lysosomal acid phosphatase-like [Contarinia nasturtii]|uniref:lysosomal acid phosphatase-like n=1 Tax=Contarinia nasturtii TaxID=265458 RepID=UPI0012D4673E|nr:lysosomal acid phosphatase-like [Contarinia nasturtii]XP_031631786.1 lysosomal acid phosphatase-like [Contarinia nasturtii]XP_031631787.1 lysosomal acid phosphatase-like [Contarinia nasturtii]
MSRTIYLCWLVLFAKLFNGVYSFQMSTKSSTESFSSESRDNNLIFVHVLCRHGSRNILKPYPNDPYKDLKFWPGGYGELNQIGVQQHFELGGYIRRRYFGLFGNEICSPNLIYVRSTDTNRVINSAKANLMNLCNETIPVHVVPHKNDNILKRGGKCDRGDYLWKKYKKSSSYLKLFKGHELLIKYLEKHSGKRRFEIDNIHSLYDTLWVEQFNGKRLPSWAKRVMVPNGEFEKLAVTKFITFTPTTELKMLRSGYLLKEILDRCKNKTLSELSPDQSQRMYMYFAHDFTVANLLNSLGLFAEPYQPPFASCIFFELYNGTNGPYLKIFYRKSADEDELSPLEIPGCGTECSLKKWYKIYKDILPTKPFDDACKL